VALGYRICGRRRGRTSADNAERRNRRLKLCIQQLSSFSPQVLVQLGNNRQHYEVRDQKTDAIQAPTPLPPNVTRQSASHSPSERRDGLTAFRLDALGLWLAGWHQKAIFLHDWAPHLRCGLKEGICMVKDALTTLTCRNCRCLYVPL
jgi:hypothetical protein